MPTGEFKRVPRSKIQAELDALLEDEKETRDAYRRYEIRRRRFALHKELARRSDEERMDALGRLERGDGLVGKFGLAISYARLFLDRLGEGRWPEALRCETFLEECRLLLGNEQITMTAQNAAMRSSLHRFRKRQIMDGGKRFYVYILPTARDQLLHIFKTAPRGFGLRERAREILILRHDTNPGPVDDSPAS